MDKVEFIRSRGSIDAGLPFSDVVRVGNMFLLSGALGNVPGSAELVPGGLRAETTQMFKNIARTLEQNGLSFDNVIKCTVMLADVTEWAAFNAIYREYFKDERLPARSAFGASGLALGARVEMECWALKES